MNSFDHELAAIICRIEYIIRRAYDERDLFGDAKLASLMCQILFNTGMPLPKALEFINMFKQFYSAHYSMMLEDKKEFLKNNNIQDEL